MGRPQAAVRFHTGVSEGCRGSERPREGDGGCSEVLLSERKWDKGSQP